MKVSALVVGCGLVLALLLSASTGAAPTDAKSACTVTCKAKQIKDDQIFVQIKIQRGDGDKKTVISSPMITMLDGRRALVQIGEIKQAAADRQPGGATRSPTACEWTSSRPSGRTASSR